MGSPCHVGQVPFSGANRVSPERNHKESAIADVRHGNRALYLLYLLNSVAQLSDEESLAFSLKYRESQILRHISKPVQTAVAD